MMQKKRIFLFCSFLLLLGISWCREGNSVNSSLTEGKTSSSQQEQSLGLSFQLLGEGKASIEDFFEENHEGDAFYDYPYEAIVSQKIEKLKEALNPNTYKIVQEDDDGSISSTVLQGERVLYNLDWSLLSQASTDGENILLCGHDECLMNDRIKELWDAASYARIYDGDFYWIEGNHSGLSYSLYKNDEVIYRFEAADPIIYPVLGFEVTAEGWWLNYLYISTKYGQADYEPEPQVFRMIHNGKELNKEQAWDHAFDLQKIDGELFYFYEKKGKIWYHYQGQDYLSDFFDVYHGGCCGYGEFNLNLLENTLYGYGLKEGKWYPFKAELVKKG